MSDHVYKLVELSGSSTIGTDDAIRHAIETRGHVANGKVAHFQVTLKAGFRLED